MGRIGLPEMLVIFAIVLLIFGPRKLPDLARGLGQAIRGFKEALREGEDVFLDGHHQPAVSEGRPVPALVHRFTVPSSILGSSPGSKSRSSSRRKYQERC